MDNEPEVIKERMEETRVSLTDKMETLESTLKETVQNTLSTASHVVENVEETVESVKDSVEESAEAVRDTVASTLESVKETVAGFFDVPGHVRRHPWAMLGGAVVLGFFGGRMLIREKRRRRRPRYEPVGAFAAPGRAPASARAPVPPPPPPAPAAHAPAVEPRAEAPAEEGPSWVGQLAGTFGDELNSLKKLALGATFGVIRDMVRSAAPEPFRDQLTDVINNFTTKAGGEPIEGPLVEPAGPDGFNQRGGGNGQRYEAEMGRPVGPAQGPCQTDLG